MKFLSEKHKYFLIFAYIQTIFAAFLQAAFTSLLPFTEITDIKKVQIAELEFKKISQRKHKIRHASNPTH